MLYRRVLERDAQDGEIIRVDRSFVVEFRRFDRGFMLHGRQSGVSAQGPASLARFMALEEARDESGIFPIAIDPFGRMLSEEGSRNWGSEVDRAFQEALSAIASQSIPDDDRAMLRNFVIAVHAAGQGITATLPDDIFAPAAEPRREEQRIALPDGSEGLVETLFEGQCDRSTGLMRNARRQVITEAEGSRRSSTEYWTLHAE